MVNTDGSYTYTPNAELQRHRQLHLHGERRHGRLQHRDHQPLTIAAVNDAPVAQDGSASGNEDTPISGTLVATDVDSPTLTYRLGTQAANGTVVVNPDGSYTYTPNPDFNGTDSFTFTASDGSGGSNTATVSLTVAAVNDPPVLDLDADDSTSSGSDYATTFTEGGAAVTIADTDIAISASTLVSATITLTNPLAGDLLSVSGTLPGGVTAVYDPATGVMTLTGTAPAAAYQAASDQIVYSNSSDNPSTDDRIITVVVNDGIDDSNTATAVVTVAAVNDPPVAQDGSASGSEDTPLSGTLAATDVDSEEPDLPPRHPGGARHRGGQSGRHLHLHARTELQRHRQLHLPGKRRRGRLQHRHRQPHHRWRRTMHRISISTPTTRPSRQRILRRRLPAPRCQSRTWTSRSRIRTAPRSPPR